MSFSGRDLALALAPLYLTDDTRSLSLEERRSLDAVNPPYEDKHFWKLRNHLNPKEEWKREDRAKQLARKKRWRDKNKDVLRAKALARKSA